MKNFSVGYYLKNYPYLLSTTLVSDSLEKVEIEIQQIPNFDRIEYILIKY